MATSKHTKRWDKGDSNLQMSYIGLLNKTDEVLSIIFSEAACEVCQHIRENHNHAKNGLALKTGEWRKWKTLSASLEPGVTSDNESH